MEVLANKVHKQGEYTFHDITHVHHPYISSRYTAATNVTYIIV